MLQMFIWILKHLLVLEAVGTGTYVTAPRTELVEFKSTL